jgi:hypothetical protein
MRAPDIALSVLFPILIAVGIALGMDAVTAPEFFYARVALILAAFLAFSLTMWWFYLIDFSWPVAAMILVTVGSVGVALVGGLKWIDEKQNTHCIIVGGIGGGDSASQGSYMVTATNHGWYPALNVRIRIVDYRFVSTVYDVGDVDPNLDRGLPNVPAFPGLGTYEILIFSRSGNFHEILKIYAVGNQAFQTWKIDRMTTEGNKIVFTPIE